MYCSLPNHKLIHWTYLVVTTTSSSSRLITSTSDMVIGDLVSASLLVEVVKFSVVLDRNDRNQKPDMLWLVYLFRLAMLVVGSSNPPDGSHTEPIWNGTAERHRKHGFRNRRIGGSLLCFRTFKNIEVEIIINRIDILKKPQQYSYIIIWKFQHLGATLDVILGHTIANL